MRIEIEFERNITQFHFKLLTYIAEELHAWVWSRIKPARYSYIIQPIETFGSRPEIGARISFLDEDDETKILATREVGRYPATTGPDQFADLLPRLACTHLFNKLHAEAEGLRLEIA